MEGKRRQGLTPVIPVLLVVAVGPVFAGDRPPLDSLMLPDAPGRLAAAVGLPADTPRARLIVDVIKVAHQVPPGQTPAADAARSAIAGWLTAAPPADQRMGADAWLVPSPLPEAAWQDVAGRLGARGDTIAGAILGDRRLAFLYLGLLGCTDETRAFLARRPDFLASIAGREPGAFAAFGRSLRIVDGRVAVPGGEAFREEWERLVGEPVADHARFMAGALARHRGRVAWFLDVLTHLPEPQRRWALDEATSDPGLRRARFRRLAVGFMAQDPRWRIEERPFARPPLDAQLVLGGVAVEGGGRWVGPQGQRFWRDLFEGRDPGADDAGWLAAVAESDPVTAGWLVDQMPATDLATARRRFAAVRFVQRLFPDAAPATLVHVLRAARGMMEVPALVLVLERLGIRDARVFADAVAHARQLSAAARRTGVVLPLVQFQSALSLLDRAVRARTVTPARAVAAVDELLTLAPQRHGFGTALASWFQATFPASDDGDAQPFSGVGVAAVAEVAWEGLTYDVAPARAEHRRLEQLLALQRAPSIAAALALATVARAWVDGPGPADPADARRALLDAAESVGLIRRHLFSGTAASPLRPLVTEVLDRQVRRDGRGLSSESVDAMHALVNTTLAEALVTMVYAISLGDPTGPVAMVPDVARRHAFAFDERGDAFGDAWQLPVERRSGARGWRVGGSLLGLEHALAPLSLRFPETGAMPEASRLSEAGQRLIALGVVLMDPARLEDETRDRLLAGIDRGRLALRRMCDISTGAEPSFVAGWRHATARWACDREPEAFDALWTDAESLEAADVTAGMPDLDPWGGAALPPEGPLRSQWLSPPSRDDLEGRPATGIVATGFVDLTLRLARLTRARDMPSAILPALLEEAAFDLLHEAPLAQPDDWYRLARQAAVLDEARVDDYIAALTARGPLVSPDAGNRP